jgi:hypothetical protein
LKEYKEGRAACGKGPSFRDRNFRKEIDHAVRRGREINELAAKIDGNSGHRPNENRKRKKASYDKEKKSQKKTKKAELPPATTIQQSAPAVSSSAPHFFPNHPRPNFQMAIHPHSSPMPNLSLHPRPSVTHFASPSIINSGPNWQQPQPPHARPSATRFATPSVINPTANWQQPQPPPSFACRTYGDTQHSSPVLPTTPMWHSGLSPYNYEIVILARNVKKCYGCGQDFVEKYRQPPHNIAVKHFDRRITGKDFVTGNLIYGPDFQNTYYHLSQHHIKRKNPFFCGLVVLQSNSYASLSDAQKQVLESCGLNVQLI